MSMYYCIFFIERVWIITRYKYSSTSIIFFLEVMSKIIIIIFSLKHWIINFSARYHNPSFKFIIYLIKLIIIFFLKYICFNIFLIFRIIIIILYYLWSILFNILITTSIFPILIKNSK